MPYAETLTDAQIKVVYNHFENGGEKPAGLTLRESFTRTMGRYVVSDANGDRIVNAT